VSVRSGLLWTNVALRALMELGIVVGLGYWGYHMFGPGTPAIVMAVAAPAVGFGFWGLVDFRWAGRGAEPLRLLQELVVSGLAAVAWYAAGRPGLGWALGGLSAVHHVLVYVLGDRLLKQRPPTAG
jgi:Protein of unknown function (DUF2568)